MIYYLTQSQYNKLWLDFQHYEDIAGRIHYMKKNYNISYSESPSQKVEGHWGIIEGDQKDINFFILKYL